MDRVIRIAAVSVEAADVDRLRQLVEAVRPQLAAVPRWTEGADADVLLIDVDSLYGHMEWVRAQGAGRRIIGLSTRAGGDGEIILRRPFEVAGMHDALAHWIGAIGGTRAGDADARPLAAATPTPAPAPAVMPAAGTAATAAPVKPAVPTPIRANGASTAAPAITPSAVPGPVPAPIAEPSVAVATEAAAAAESPAAPVAHELPLAAYCGSENLPRASRLVLGDAPAITIDNETGVYFGPPGLKPLEPYCRELIPRDAWVAVSPMVLDGLRAAGGGLPTSRLVWFNALHAGAGQLVGASANARVRLAKWPQIEREFPRHFRIATVMMKGFAGVEDIAAQSGAQVAEVADFVNASLVAGHAEVEPTAQPASGPAETATGGLLGRLGLRGRKG